MSKKIHFLLNVLLAVLAAGLFSIPAAMSAFDPVNDDTDIFLANPSIAAERPNVLIILDNTANWNQPFVNEKAALVQVVNSLSSQFNVGLMMMVETGGGNDNVDGAYVRYHVRQMTDTNKIALSTMVSDLDILGDKANNNSAGFALHEAYLYFAGKASRASHGKRKTDFAGNTANNPLAAPLAGHALPASPNASSLYTSPVTDGCQKNFIIYISNGPANENASARSELEGYLGTLTGVSPPATIAINPDGQQGNWADEMAKYMANADVNTNIAGTQNVITYAVEVNPSSTGQGPAMTGLLNSVAFNGKGKYFGVTDDAGGASIINALNTIFSEVQAVNSVFAATTLPVSVNVRGTNLNQVYIGVFRPDANKAPAWLGNLKMYNLALNSSGGVFLADAQGNPAQNPNTGFITAAAPSFWTTPSSFWGFRPSDQNGAGGVSDFPDGDLVEKGGVAEQLRIAYATSENATPARNLYTCTTGPNYPNCTPLSGFSLSSTPFHRDNTDITAVSLQLDTRPVSPLTGFAAKTVTALTDRKSVTLDNAGGISRNITSLTNGGTTVALSSLNTNVSTAISSLSATQIGSAVSGATGNNVTKSGGTCTVTFGSAINSTQFVVGATFQLSATGWGGQNGVSATILTTPTATSFTYSCTGNDNSVTGTGTATILTFPSTTAVATFAAAHSFTNGQTVVISGAAPSQFNATAGITVVSTTKISYTIGTASGAATTAGTASATSTAAKATTATNHGLPAGTSNAIITGATPAGYDCPSGCTVTNTGANTFTYTVGSALTPATTLPQLVRGGGTTVTATTSIVHGFLAGATVNIQGATPSGYNGSVTVATVPTTTTFTYTASSVLPAASGSITVSSANSATVTATAANHGFAVNDSVVIESVGATNTVHPGTYTVLSIGTPTANSFTYSTGSALATPSGTFTVRPASAKAYVALTAHGYATNDLITIAGATPAGYNGAKTITVVDANSFTYPLSTALGANTGTTVTASKKSTTAIATSTAHGFADGTSVDISGATPNTFNGTFNIVRIDANTFSYTLGSAEGDASGTINAVQGVSSGRGTLIRWVRGQDNFKDENTNGSTTDIRAYVHGDVLHSRPAVINYNRYGSDNDVYVYYGANDGVFRAVKGGFATDATAAVNIAPGNEAWGFVPPEFFDDLNRLRKNSPIISSSFKKPYFADGSIGIYTKDANNNGKFGDSGDKVNLYLSMRRGGRFVYALDVNDPHDPKYLWKIDNSVTGFEELGQTWSQPTVISNLAGYPNPVLVFGAGYDPTIEDLDPANITASTATTVTTGTGGSAITYTRNMGRGIYVVDALTGALLWRTLGTGTAAANTAITTGMDYAIPSNVSMVKNESGPETNRGYVGDTGGNMWRVDFRYNALTGWTNTTVTKLAAVGGSGAAKRKFLNAPDVVRFTDKGFDAVLSGSGDREHPFDTSVTNRFYMFKDFGSDAGPLTGTTGATGTNPSIVEGTMFDATNNCIQEQSACGTGVTSVTARASLNAATGYYVTLGTGEKVVSTAISVDGTTFFNTNQPSASAGGGTCGSNLGIARQYQIGTGDATAINDLNASGSLTVADRSRQLAGGGYAPDPVRAVVKIGDKIVQAVISGPDVAVPPGLSLNSRLRRYWYKEID
jgi:type IV pilus assembly protein PilY1